MDNKEFKVRIVDLYKDIDKPIINNLYENDQTKEIMELSERSELLLLKKDKNRWVLKDKRKLLKEIDIVKNRKVREFSSSISKLGKHSPNINLMKDTNNKMISDLESIDNLKKSLNDDNVYSKLQNATSINYLSKDNLKETPKENNKITIPVIKQNDKLKNNTITISNSKSVIKSKQKGGNQKKTLSDISQLSESESEDYIEIFSNQK
jgi:hypothetical protein